jgi:hypothetical protein
MPCASNTSKKQTVVTGFIGTYDQDGSRQSISLIYGKVQGISSRLAKMRTLHSSIYKGLTVNSLREETGNLWMRTANFLLSNKEPPLPLQLICRIAPRGHAKG